MRTIVCDNCQQAATWVAELFKAQIMLKPKSVLGLATGSTPIEMYHKLAEMNLDFSQVTTFNLDEYYPINRDNDQSYFYFMNQHLFSKVNLDMENVYIPNGQAADYQEECANYERLIEQKGGIDLQLLGIGENGHIGFNEPSESLFALTHLTDLTEDTIIANSRFFQSKDLVPKKALTMGVATIMKARKIVLMAFGENKKHAVKAILSNMVDTRVPATVLSMHSDVTIVCDRKAYE